MGEKDGKQVGISPQEVIAIVREKTGVGMGEITSRSRNRKVVKARALYCYLAKERSGVSGGELMRQLNFPSGGISHLISRGREYYQLGNY